MKFLTSDYKELRGLLVLCVGTLVAAGPSLQCAALAISRQPGNQTHTGVNSSQSETILFSTTATASKQGVLVQWRTGFEINNIGFNLYRLRNGNRKKINREIIAGSAFIAGENKPLLGGYSYSFLDPAGTADSVYYIESLAVNGSTRIYNAVTPALKDRLPDFNQSVAVDKLGTTPPTGGESGSSQKEFVPPDALSESTTAALENQWAIASQTCLKIFIKKDGWYRVTQQQSAGVGFAPAVDVRNLHLYTGGREVAIRTSKGGGQFAPNDYLEFYGQGLDIPTSDERTYYLTGDTTAGLRTQSDLRINDLPEQPLQRGTPSPAGLDLTQQPVFLWIYRVLNVDPPAINEPDAPKATGDKQSQPSSAVPLVEEPTKSAHDQRIEVTPIGDVERDIAAPASLSRERLEQSSNVVPAQSIPRPVVASSRKKRAKRKNRSSKQTYNHAALDSAAVAPSFDFTIERKDRSVYFSSLLNGEAENFFGSVLSSSPVPMTLNVANLEATATGPAKLEVALQGANSFNHDVDVQVNDIPVGVLSFFGLDHAVQTLDVPLTALQAGTNTVKLAPRAGAGLSLVDYIRLTYPHSYRADNDSVRLPLRLSQSAQIDGFTTPNLKLIDYTDPFAVRVSRPISIVSGPGFAIQVGPGTIRSKSRRQVYVIPESSFDQPAGFALNQRSALNATGNEADLLIIAHSSLLSSVAPLVNLRRSQGMTVSLVDVEDVYDEFSFGVHGPQAIRDFLSHAMASWSRAPHYLLLVGDASLDPRNYTGSGNLDLVPTKLIDTQANETSTDEWFSDSNNDGIGEIPTGRLPVTTVSEANKMIGKIVSYSPANVPQTALLVGDAQCLMRSFGLDCYFFSFKEANDEVQALISPTLTVQRVDRPTAPSEAEQSTDDAQMRADLIAKFNQGQALVNYSGHGNVDTWTGASVFTSADATAATNGNKLPFVVVMDCLNGYFQDPNLNGLAEALMKAENGGAVAAFASSGLTTPDSQHEMSKVLYASLYGSQSVPLGDAIKTAKAATFDIDVRRTWIFFGDPSMKIR